MSKEIFYTYQEDLLKVHTETERKGKTIHPRKIFFMCQLNLQGANLIKHFTPEIHILKLDNMLELREKFGLNMTPLAL
jgi:hypothetical protein